MGLDASFYIGIMDGDSEQMYEVCNMRGLWVLNQYIMAHYNNGIEGNGEHIKVSPEMLSTALIDITEVLKNHFADGSKLMQIEFAKQHCPVSSHCHIEVGTDEYYDNCAESAKYICEILKGWIQCMQYIDGSIANIYYYGWW